MNIKNSLNLEIMKCYNILFTKDGLKRNTGNYIILSILLINIVNNILFIFKGYKSLNKIIDNFLLKKQSLCCKIKEKKLKKIKKAEKVKDKKFKDNRIISLNKRKRNKKINILKTNVGISIKNSSELQNINNQNLPNINNLKKNNYNDYELNNLSYEKALLIDKRNYINYYFSLLKRKFPVVFTFYTKNDYNSRNIKISLFLFSFSLFYTVNALFYNDTIMHQIYINKGEFIFIYRLPQILFSTIISGIINTIITYFSLTENIILELKNINAKSKKKVEIIKKNIKMKFIIFYILNYSLLILFWYYLSCFCCIYKNTQLHLIKDTLISYSLSFIYPEFLCLIPGIFRITSLRAKKKDKVCLYKISKFIQFII